MVWQRLFPVHHTARSSMDRGERNGNLEQRSLGRGRTRRNWSYVGLDVAGGETYYSQLE